MKSGVNEQCYLEINMCPKTTGFTLVEVMIVIAIVAILAAVATPSFKSTIASSRMRSEINELAGGLSFARSEAMKRGQSVTVCPVSGTGCATSASSWPSGWIVLLDATQQQLQVSAGVSHGDSLTSNVATAPQFTAAGYTFFTGTLSLHDQNSTQSLYRCIIFNAGSWVTAQGASCP